MLCPPLQAQVLPAQVTRRCRGRDSGTLVAKLPLACKIFRDVLRGWACCLLGNGCSHRHNASSFVLA